MENSKEPEKKKIKEEDLGTVSGGCGKKPKPEPKRPTICFTQMECHGSSVKCNFLQFWNGDYVNGKKYQCPGCDQWTLIGIRKFEP